MTLSGYAKQRKISRQTLYTRIRQAEIEIKRDKAGDLSMDTVKQLDTLLDTAQGGVKGVDVKQDVKLDIDLDTNLDKENAVLKARITALEETLAFTRAELERTQNALENAQRIADQAQQLQARAMLPLWQRIKLNLTEGRKNKK